MPDPKIFQLFELLLLLLGTFSFRPSGHKNGGWDSKGAAIPENGWRKCHRQGILERDRVEKANEFHCLWASKAGRGRGCLLEVTWRGWMVRRVKDLHPANQSWKGFFWRIAHVECWTPSSVPGNKTPEKQIWGFTEKCSPPTSHKSDQSHQECSPVFQWALERSEVSRCTIPACETSCRKSESSAPVSAQQHPSPYQNPASDEGCHKEMPKVRSPYTPSLLLFLQQEYESSPEEICQWGMIFLWLLPGWEIMPCFFANCLICRAEHIGLMSNWYIPLQTADPTTEWDANLIIPHVGNRNGISLLNLFSYVGKIKNKKRCWSGLCELNTFHSPELERNELCYCCRSLTG